jgi:serine/threonine protein kinase
MCRVNHPCCVYLIAWDFIQAPEPLCIFVTELMPTDLATVLKKAAQGQTPEAFNETRKSCIAFAIAFGMAYLHSENIVHRDLKPANILMDEDYSPRIADFGFAKLISLENSLTMTRRLGTPAYMAPELIVPNEGMEIFGAVDVFAFGMVLWELLEEKSPFCEFKSPDAVMHQILKVKRPTIPGHAPPELQQLISLCWSHLPSQRPRFDGR